MNKNFHAQIIRSVQKGFITAFAALESGVPVFCEGQKLNPRGKNEIVMLYIQGPKWLATNSSTREAEITLSAVCSVKGSANPHRIAEIAGAAATAAARKVFNVMSYPDTVPVQVGVARFFDADTVPLALSSPHGSGGAAKINAMQSTVTVGGRVEIQI